MLENPPKGNLTEEDERRADVRKWRAEIEQLTREGEQNERLAKRAKLAKARLEEEADLLLKEAETAADLGDQKKAEKAARKLFAKKYRDTGAARVGRERWPDLAREIEDAERDKK